MKHIIAIIRISKMNETKLALEEAGLPSFTALGVLGRGQGRGLGPTYQEILENPENKEALAQIGPEPRLKSKRLIMLIVPDEKKDIAVGTIIKVNQTGNSGDGKIFVVDTVDSIRIRSGESGDITLD